jgi:hypothetical protein
MVVAPIAEVSPLNRLATKAPATTEMSDPKWLIHRVISFAWIASMHVPVAPATQAGARSEVNSKDIDSSNARRPAWSRIKGPKMSPDFNMMPSAADRLLPLAQVNATGEFPGTPKARQPSLAVRASNIQLTSS